MKDGKIKKFLLTCIKPASLIVAAIVGCAFVENPFGQTETAELFEKLHNIFTVPGVVFAGVGLLSYFNYLGAYDGLAYAFSNFGLHNLWVSRRRDKYKSLYDYKKAKDEKGRKWMPNVLFVGSVSLFIGIIFLIIYYCLL